MDSDTIWVYYKDRLDWKDVIPVQQCEEDLKIVNIDYSEKYRDVHDYLRAVMRMDERSERTLDLTTDAIHLNPANYTVWQYRRNILTSLGRTASPSGLLSELSFVTSMIEENEKNYQVWFHRRCIIQLLCPPGSQSGAANYDPAGELEFTARMLESDAKNYHAWEHRQWAVKTYALWAGELAFIESLLSADLRNNSAWNHRHLVVSCAPRALLLAQLCPEPEQSPSAPEDSSARSNAVASNNAGDLDNFDDLRIRAHEERYAISYIKKAPNNESAWNYLRGVYDERPLCECSAAVRAFCEELETDGSRSFHLHQFVLDMLEDQLSAADFTARPPLLQRVLEVCEKLRKEDPIRLEYYIFRERDLQARFSAS